MNAYKSVLLINLPGESIRKPEEHCGLAFLKAFLNQKGIKTDILDAYAQRLDLDECKQKITEWMKNNQGKIHYIGISPFVTSYNSFVEIGIFSKAMEQSCIVFAGGHFASLNKEYLMSSCRWLDAIIVGEGEISTFEFISNDRSINIPGVYCRQYENMFIQRERIENLDELPFQERYLSLTELEGQPMAITTSRGCYGECSFCSISSFYKLNSCNLKQTYRSAQSVSSEIHELVDLYKISSLKIVDDNFFRNTNDDFLKELVTLLKDVKVTFRLSARPNDITAARAELLKKMGAVIVGIGVESADEKSLKIFNKGIPISDSERAIKYLTDNEILCLANFIMFNPIIDVVGVKKNCAFVKKHVQDSVFHRINSHLWIRSTDPIVKKLTKMELCKQKGFPYVECDYKHEDVLQIRRIFDLWCNHNMSDYYRYADVLMANGKIGYEAVYNKYKKMLEQDVYILERVIALVENGLIIEAEAFVNEEMLKG